MLRILILSFYYQPDLCAGSFRTTSLVEHFSRRAVQIDLVTTAPNRYASFKPKAAKFESEGNVRLHRIPLLLCPRLSSNIGCQRVTSLTYW